MNQMITKVAREMAGEIYSPVTLIKGYVDLLERRIRDGAHHDPDSLNFIIREIKENCTRATGIAESLQDLTVGNAGESPVLTTAPQIVERATAIFFERLKKLGIRLQVRHENPEVKFLSQQMQIVQVLACMLDQAVDRVKKNSVKGVGVDSLFRREDQHRGVIVIHVHDSGSHKLQIPRVDFCLPILSRFNGELELVNSSFGACLELRFPIEIK